MVPRFSELWMADASTLLPPPILRRKRQGQETKGGLNPHQIRPSFREGGMARTRKDLLRSGVSKDSWLSYKL